MVANILTPQWISLNQCFNLGSTSRWKL